MARSKKPREKVRCRFFLWALAKRGDIYYADGRSNELQLGRYSLGTGNWGEAMVSLDQLDKHMAIKEGLLPRSEVEEKPKEAFLSLEEGRRLYDEYAARPQVAEGVRDSTRKRYRAVFDKFLRFSQSYGISNWNQVGKDVLTAYARWLEDDGYAQATQYLEISTIKQVCKWLIEEHHLPETCRFRFKVTKNLDSTRYCWKNTEFLAIVEFCRERAQLKWLAELCLALGYTGMRISEAAALRWSDIDLEKEQIRLIDESRSASVKGERRTLKNHRARSFPINEKLLPSLKAMSRGREGFVFHGPRGGRLKPDTVRNILIREVLVPLRERFPSPANEQGFADGRLHSFRHFFCSLCANCGVPERSVMQWLGHSDAAMVRRYYHLDHDEARRHMRQVIVSGTVVGAGNSSLRKKESGRL